MHYAKSLFSFRKKILRMHGQNVLALQRTYIIKEICIKYNFVRFTTQHITKEGFYGFQTVCSHGGLTR